MKHNEIYLKRYLFYFLTLLLPNTITVLSNYDFFPQWLKSVMVYLGLENMITPLKIILIILIMVFIPMIISLLESKIISDRQNKTIKMFNILINSIEEIVDCKKKRVFQNSRNITGVINTKDIFNAIVQPFEQITKIHSNMTSCFQAFYDDDSIKLSIIECKDNSLFRYIIHSDDDPKITCSQLNENDSLVKECHLSKRTIIAPTRKEISYLPSSSSIQSILCFPIINGQYTKYVITLTSKEPKTFVEKHKKQLDYMLEHFSKRFILEMYLNTIKEKITNETQN